MFKWKDILQQNVMFSDSEEAIEKKASIVAIEVLNTLLQHMNTDKRIDTLLNIKSELEKEISSNDNNCRFLVKNSVEKNRLIKEKQEWITSVLEKERKLLDKRQFKFNSTYATVFAIATIFLITILSFAGAPLFVSIGIAALVAAFEIYQTNVEKEVNVVLLALEKYKINKDLEKIADEKDQIEKLKKSVFATKFITNSELGLKIALEEAFRVVEQRLIVEKANNYNEEYIFEKEKVKVLTRS